MAIDRRELLTGMVATAAVSLIPSLPASAVAVTIDASFRFAVPRRMFSTAYFFNDPWRVDFGRGEPHTIIHEASGVVFWVDPSHEMDASRHVVVTAIWPRYAPRYRLTATRFDEREGVWTPYDLPPPASNKAMEEGDFHDLTEIRLAARMLAQWARQLFPPAKPNGTLLLRPYEEIQL